MIEWIKANKAGIIVVGAALALAFVLFSAQGCAVEDFVKMKTTPKLQQVTGAAPVISVGEYPDTRQEFVDATARELEKNDAEYASKSVWVNFLNASVTTWQPVAEGYLATVPGGTLLAGLLFGAGGLLIRKPGDGKVLADMQQQLADQALAYQQKIAAEKMASFNKGLEEGKASK